VFVSLVTLVNLMLAPIGDVAGAPVTLERIFGYVFAPLAYMIGVPWDEAVGAGNFLGVKLFLTEFIAYVRLGEIAPDALSERTRVLLAYALCGFANVGSVGILVSGLAVLLPERRTEVLELAWKALTPGFLATCMTAGVVAAMPGAMFGF
jgi:CNT family concentrative nucleoside transporter